MSVTCNYKTIPHDAVRWCRPLGYRPTVVFTKGDAGRLTELTQSWWNIRGGIANLLDQLIPLYEDNPVARRLIQIVAQKLEAPYWHPTQGHQDQGVALSILNDHCEDGVSIGITAGRGGMCIEVSKNEDPKDEESEDSNETTA